MLTHYSYPIMRRTYGLAIRLTDWAARFERYAYNWLTLFEGGDLIGEA